MRWIEGAGILTVMAAVLAAGVWAQSAAPPALPPAPPPPAPVQVQPPQFVVVLDAAHGGSDTGARFGHDLLEKEITLSLSVHLRSTLHARGIDVVTTRESDIDVPLLNRAETANHAQAAACLVLHATATGSGVHLFTSSLNSAPNMPLLPWDRAQAPWSTQSLKLESEIDTALAHTDIPVTLGRASVEPMDHLTCPEVAVELAPLVGGHVSHPRAITDSAYQKEVVDSLAAALEQWRSDWKQ